MAAIGEILGQKRPLETVNRIIESGKRGQAVLLTGPAGIGKFALGVWMAMRFICQKDNSGCGQCLSCRCLKNFKHPDFLLVFPFPNLTSDSRKNTVFHFSDPVNSDARYSDDSLDEVNRFLAEKSEDTYRIISFEKKQNIPVEVIRDLIRAVGKRPLLGAKRVVMVCEIEKMAFGASDLFLKTVEEPPEDSLIILTSAKPQFLLPTLLSRTIRISLTPVQDDLVRNYIAQTRSDGATDLYLRLAAGSPGLALKAIEDNLQARRDALWKIVSEYIEKGQLPKTIEALRRHCQRLDFDDARNDFSLLQKILRDIYIAKIGLDNKLINIDIKNEMIKIARSAPQPATILAWLRAVTKAGRVHEINNVSVDLAFIGMFIEFDRASGQN
jgi:DNA polymerase-3 subunit delta'